MITFQSRSLEIGPISYNVGLKLSFYTWASLCGMRFKDISNTVTCFTSFSSVSTEELFHRLFLILKL